MNPSTEDMIRENAELVIKSMKSKLGVELDYDTDSVIWVDGYIERNRTNLDADQIDGLVNVLGSFLGECIRRNYGGEWEERDGTLCVSFDEKNGVFPFNKIRKQFENGSEDSIASFFTMIPIVFGKTP